MRRTWNQNCKIRNESEEARNEKWELRNENWEAEEFGTRGCLSFKDNKWGNDVISLGIQNVHWSIIVVFLIVLLKLVHYIDYKYTFVSQYFPPMWSSRFSHLMEIAWDYLFIMEKAFPSHFPRYCGPLSLPIFPFPIWSARHVAI